MKFAAGITLYNPTPLQLEHIKEYGKSFDYVFLFDNSEPEYKQIKNDFGDNFIVLSKGYNVGLPSAFNEIIKNEKCQEIDFLCTLDQDSVFSELEIQKLKDEAKKKQQEIEDKIKEQQEKIEQQQKENEKKREINSFKILLLIMFFSIIIVMIMFLKTAYPVFKSTCETTAGSKGTKIIKF